MDIDQRFAALETKLIRLQDTVERWDKYFEAADAHVERYGEMIDRMQADNRAHGQEVSRIIRGYKDELNDIKQRVYDSYYHLFPQMVDVDIALLDARDAARKEKGDKNEPT